MSHILKITTIDGHYKIVPYSNVVSVSAAPPSLSQGNKVRGLITAVKYLDAAALAAPVVTEVNPVPAYDGTNTKYQYGCINHDGSFTEYLSNV